MKKRSTAREPVVLVLGGLFVLSTALGGCATNQPAAAPGGEAASAAEEATPVDAETAASDAPAEAGDASRVVVKKRPAIGAGTSGGAPAEATTSGATAESPNTQEAGQGTSGDQVPVATPAPVAAPEPAQASLPPLSGAAKEAHTAGLKAFVAGDLAGAKAQFSKAIKEDKKAHEAYYALGLVQERQGSPNDAGVSYKQALAIAPSYEPAIVAQALVLARQGNTDGALSFLRDKQSKFPASAAVLAAMAEVKSLSGDSGEAQRLAQESLKKDPNYKPAMVTLARDHYRARRIDLSLYALQGILDGYGVENPARDKNNAEARFLRGLIYSERGLRGPAMEDLKKATSLRPDLVEAHLLLARFMMEAGNAKEAAPHLEMAIRYDNRNVPAHLMLGDAYRLLDRAADARKELEWVIAADPTQLGARYNLGLLFLMSSKLPGLTELQATNKAIEQLEAYKAKAPRGGPDDVDELIVRAKSRKALLEAEGKGKGGV